MGVEVVTPVEELNRPIRGVKRMGFVCGEGADPWSEQTVGRLAILYGFSVPVIGITVGRDPRTSW